MYIQYVVRALISLVAMFVITKAIGSRQVSEMSMFDYVNGITMGSVAAEIVFFENDIWGLLLALVFYGIAAIGISCISDKSLTARRMIEGKPKVLFQNGTFVYHNMKKSKIDLCEFLMLCREQGYFDVSQVQCVVLESNGKMSILPKSEYRPVTPSDMEQKPAQANLFSNIIMEGNIMYGNLKSIGRDENWLRKQMQIHNITDEKDVFLAACENGETCYFFSKTVDSKPVDKLI